MPAPHVYVYGVVRAGRRLPPALRGVGDPPGRLRLLALGGTATVVGDAPEVLRARRRDLMAHQDVLLTLAADGPVLPMRFGMVSPDEDTVRAQVSAAESDHLASLDRLDGRFEMNVKAFPAQDALEPLVREDARVRRLREEARRRPGYEADIRLGEAIATALGRRAATAAAEALRKLTDLAEDVARGPEVAGCALNASFLVAAARGGTFRSAVEAFAAGHRDRVELRLTGPLPCYSFATAEPATARV